MERYNMKVLWVFLMFCNLNGCFCLKFQIGKQGHREASFERFDGCCDHPNNPIIFAYQGMRFEGSKVWINCTYTVRKDVLVNPSLTLRLERCKNRENLDTCEQFYTYRADGVCKTLDTESALWTPFFSSFKPPWKCPFKKGVYKATDAELDASAFLLFPLDSWYWKVKTQLHDKETNDLLMCILVEAHIVTRMWEKTDTKSSNDTTTVG